MNITQENIDNLNAVLRVQLSPDDYKPRVDEAIKKYKKKVNMPGFRPGHVPESLVRKMYGKSVLVEELNRLVSDSVDKFITDNNLKVLGNPLPKAETELSNDWEAPKDFEFAFDMALAPQVQLNLPPSHTFLSYDIKVEDSAIDEEVDKLARRYGNYTSPDTTDGDCSVYGSFEQLGSDGNPIEGGLNNRAFMMLTKIRDEYVRQRFVGASVGAQIVFNPMASIGSDEEVRYLLGIRSGGLESADADFRFTLERINKVEKAAIDQGLFDQVYGEGNVTDEAGFRQRIHDEIAQGYRYESENALQHEIEDVLLNEAALSLPDEFLRRWLKHSNEKITDEQLDKEYHQYARDLKWRLIENTIYAEQNMEISKEEIESYARNMIIDQYLRYGQAHMLTEDKVVELVQRYLANQESVQRVVENLSRRKVFEYMNGIVKKDVKSVTHTEFTDLMSRHHHHH
ncbi:MAG: hypothetical protein RLZZ630_1578 [Bacteroidota bacterium]|jgi:trigger factor